MKTDIWAEAKGPLLRETLTMEARRWQALHRPPTSLDDWQEWRRRLRARIGELAGLRAEPAPLAVETHGELPMDGYTIVKLTYQSRPGFRVTANLYRPDGPGPFPGILNVHGHWPQGKIAARVASRGHLLAKNGFVVLIVDAFGSGERGTRPGEYEYHGRQLGASLMTVGRTLLGMQVQDNMRAIDLLQSLAVVDPTRIGVTGASGGGNQTMWVTALDERVKAAVPVVSVGTFESYIATANCVCETLPQGLCLMEEWVPLALAAPNPLLILNAMQDISPAFSLKEMVRSHRDARLVYDLYGAADRLQFQTFDMPHGYWPEMLAAMLAWFRLWLKDEKVGWACPLPPLPEVDEIDLKCFPDDRRPATVKSIVAFVDEEADRLAAANAAAPLAAAAKRAELQALIRLPAGPANPVVSRPTVRLEGGRREVGFVVEPEPGRLVPCLLIGPVTSTGEVVVAAHPGGKTAAAEQPEVAALLAQGRTLCLIDLCGTGETRWDESHVAPEHEAARSALWLGRTMVGDWTRDLFAVRAALADLLPNAACGLLAWGEAALAALAASALGDGFASVSPRQVLATYRRLGATPKQTMAIFVPGILAWGDVSLIAALAQAPIVEPTPVDSQGDAVDTATWQQEIDGLRARMSAD